MSTHTRSNNQSINKKKSKNQSMLVSPPLNIIINNILHFTFQRHHHRHHHYNHLHFVASSVPMFRFHARPRPAQPVGRNDGWK